MAWSVDVEQLVEAFRRYLEERMRSGIKLDGKAITSEKTIQVYVGQLKWLLYNFMIFETPYPPTSKDARKMIMRLYKMGYSYQTLTMAYSVLKNLYRCMGWEWSLKWRDLGIQPRLREAPYLELEEMRSVVKLALARKDAPPRDKALMSLVFHGIRPVDISSLTAGNVLIDGEAVEIRYVPRKRGKPVARILDPAASRAVIEWLKQLAELFGRREEVAYDAIIEGGGVFGLPENLPLFPRYISGPKSPLKFGRKALKDPRPISPKTIWRIVKKYCYAALEPVPKRILPKNMKIGYTGEILTPYCPYGFRRGAITALLENAGMSIQEVSKLYGITPSTALRYFKRPIREISEKALRTLSIKTMRENEE